LHKKHQIKLGDSVETLIFFYDELRCSFMLNSKFCSSVEKSVLFPPSTSKKMLKKCWALKNPKRKNNKTV